MIFGLRPKNCLMALAGSAILGFGLFNIHSFSGVTEGGTLGLTLLLQRWFDISPSVSGLVMNIICYLIGLRTFGREFIGYSAIACGGFSLFYAVFERIGPLFPGIGGMPLAAAVMGAVFVGVGVGLGVRAGGAPAGDDALAMSLSRMTGLGIEWMYLISDLSVLALSLTYIPVRRILYSLITVVLSGQIIGWIQRVGRKTQER